MVGKDAETFERMKAWKEGEGDFAVLFPSQLASCSVRVFLWKP